MSVLPWICSPKFRFYCTLVPNELYLPHPQDETVFASPFWLHQATLLRPLLLNLLDAHQWTCETVFSEHLPGQTPARFWRLLWLARTVCQILLGIDLWQVGLWNNLLTRHWSLGKPIIEQVMDNSFRTSILSQDPCICQPSFHILISLSRFQWGILRSAGEEGSMDNTRHWSKCWKTSGNKRRSKLWFYSNPVRRSFVL